MVTLNPTSINSFFNTREILLINNEKFPPLELYFEKYGQLKYAYIDWLKKERLGRNVCYLDLTFEVPSKSDPITLSIISSRMTKDVYPNLLEKFILGGNTLYSHHVFKDGIPNSYEFGSSEFDQSKKSVGHSEQFLLYELNNDKEEPIDPVEIDFSIDIIPLAKFLHDAIEESSKRGEDYLKNVDSTNIKEHWVKWVELHKEQKKNIRSNVDGELKWILVVPLGILTISGQYKPIGSIFLGLDNNCKEDDVIYFTRSLIILILSSSQRYYAKIALKNSIKSAVSAIMSRNMSHNLGSHVLSNLKGELDDFGKIFKENFDLNNNIPFKSENLFGLKWFINYLQERQDFIATIGGFENQTFMPVNFKTFVFDGLLPDHQFKRHSPSTSLNAHKNYLLEFIVKSENIQRDRIVIKYKHFDSSVHDASTDKDYKDLTQLNVSFPGGIVGRQAFFSIFENIIRNAAKHSEIKDKLEITIDTPDHTNYDTNEYIKFTLTDNLGTFNVAQSNLRRAMNEPIFNESQEKQGNKGIKEMKISAAWLRGIRLEDIDSYKEEINEKYFIKHPKILDIAESDGSIQYIFYLLKPKELVIYINNSESNSLTLTHDELKLFNESGIDIITPEYFEDGNNYNLRHSLFVILKANETEIEQQSIIDKNIEKYFNQRRLILSTSSFREIFFMHRNKPENLINAFWKLYLDLDQKLLQYIDIRPAIVEKVNMFENFRVVNISDSKKYDYPDIKILFNHHNDSENAFNIFKSDNSGLFDNLQFLEGISGGNSTELLTSRTEKSELFFYKLFQSCITDIILIDERLWNNNSKISINQLQDMFNEDMQSFNQEMLNEINKIEDINKWGIEILTKLNIAPTEKLQKSISSIYRIRHNSNFLKVIIKKLDLKVVQEKLTDCKKDNEYKYSLYKKKNIEVINILFDNKHHKFELYNLNLDKVGEYSNDNELRLYLNLSEYQHKIVSIHQGIIDKIQNMLNSRESEDNGIPSIKINAIDILNRSIPGNFIKIIHSGRGKPSVEIPEKFHFVPYASLESAFYDCKFSLTDLLFNAKAELS